MTTRTVNISLLEQTPQQRTISFIPRIASIDGVVLLEKSYSVRTEANGTGTIDLPVKDTGNLLYDFEIPKRDGKKSYGHFVLEAGAPVDLAALIVAGGALTDSLQEYVDEQLALHAGGVSLGETSSTAYRGDRGKVAFDHTSTTNNPHSVTKAQVGLGNVDNTADTLKPVSTAQAAADAAAIAAAEGYSIQRSNHTGSQAISTVTNLQAGLDAKAPLDSPALINTPTAPTQTAGNNSTLLANTAFVKTAVDTAVANLVNGAPGALDALNELATALGNDPSFATTMTNALAAKVPTTRTVNGHALSADVTVTKSDVGLGNVDNTSDANKPISTATQTVLDIKAAANGQDTYILGTINADQNNYNPGSRARVIHLTSTAGGQMAITGLNFGSAAQIGERHLLFADATVSILLPHNSASSTAGNRFYSFENQDKLIHNGEWVEVVYSDIGGDGSVLRWLLQRRPLASEVTGLSDALSAKLDNGSSFDLGFDNDHVTATNGTLTARSGNAAIVRMSHDDGDKVSLGDVDGAGNGTIILIDDVAQMIVLVAGNGVTVNGLPAPTSGTYTPDMVPIGNIQSSIQVYECQWMRVGNVVTVSGRVDFKTTTNIDTAFSLSLPIAAVGLQVHGLGGTGFDKSFYRGFSVFGDADVYEPPTYLPRARFAGKATGNDLLEVFFAFMYRIV